MDTVDEMFPAAIVAPGLTWRAARRHDVPDLEALERASRGGTSDPATRAQIRRLIDPAHRASMQTLCAIEGAGCLVGFAAVVTYSTEDEHRADLIEIVHPRHRGRGLRVALLAWAEACAQRRLAPHPPDRPRILRIAFTDDRPDALPIYERNGFRSLFVSATMRRDLGTALPAWHTSDDATFACWTGSRAVQFHSLYTQAFRARPRASVRSFARWHSEMVSPAAFRANLSTLLIHGATPVGYVLCWLKAGDGVERALKLGVIAQLGVHPLWQGRGFGTALLGHALGCLREEGLDAVELEVNCDNGPALRLYTRLGFEETARLSVYARPV